jgi:excisionase family DNA binding protein
MSAASQPMNIRRLGLQAVWLSLRHATLGRVACMSIAIADTIEQHGALTSNELAALLSVSPKSIYAWVKSGTLSAIQLGAPIRFDPHMTAE